MGYLLAYSVPGPVSKQKFYRRWICDISLLKIQVSLISRTSLARLNDENSDIVLNKHLFRISVISVLNLFSSLLYQPVANELSNVEAVLKRRANTA